MTTTVDPKTTLPAAPDALSPVKRALLELRDMRARLDDVTRRQHEPIAIVGMGLRFPGGAHDSESFWTLLHDGVDAIREVPADRWDVDALYDPDPDRPGTIATRWGGFLDQVDQFEPELFGISPREAVSVDPQQRLLLEVAWEALEHAAQAPDQLFDSRTGVFLGISNSDYWRLLLEDADRIDAYTTSGNALSVAAGRLSYTLGLRGPCIALDTACSSSLVALHLAVRSLRAAECDVALAGGVSLILTPELTINFSKAGMMAPDGRCKTFDASADGYVRSEGCGIVVLKRLSDALDARDPILAVVRGTAINQDGRSGGLTAPNGPAQEEVIREALEDGGVRAEEIGYVEAHGTGTPLGDPIEVRALAAVLGRDRPADHPLAIGSVKTNLGHLEAAAGVAGLIKTVLMLQHGEIPPHLHLTAPNPHLDLDQTRLVIPTVPTPWDDTAGRRLAGVSSFGLSGTNAHVVVEEAPRPVEPALLPERPLERPLHLLTLSARTPTALAALSRRYERHLATQSDQTLAELCFSAAAGRSHLVERLAVVAASPAELCERLAAHRAGDDVAGATRGRVSLGSRPEVAFLFTGQGSQYVDMGRGLYQSQPVFRAAIDRCAVLLRPHLDRPLIELLYPDASTASSTPGTPDALLANMAYAQPAQFALQVALVELWRSWGVDPTLVAGHSVGEFAAAWAAGVFSLEDGLKLVAARGRLLQSLPQTGEMVVVFASEARVAAAIAPYGKDVSIAAVNGPESVVLSGTAGAVRAAVADLRLDEQDWRRLDIPAASHSALVEPILDAFERVAAEVSYSQPRIQLVSTLTGRLASAGDLSSPDYWRRHLRQPVRFDKAIAELHAQGCNAFVEIGPHPTLLGMGRRCLGDDVGTWLPSLRRGQEDWSQILESVAQLYVGGVDVDWEGFDRPYARRRVALPTYPWERRRFWAPSAERRRSVPAAPTAVLDAAFAAGERQSDQGPLDLALSTYPAKWDYLDRLATAYIVDALRTLGAFSRPGERHTAETLAAAHAVDSGYGKLLQRWLGHVADAGLLERQGQDTFVGHQPLPDPQLAALEAAGAVALGDVPRLLAYVTRCGRKLADILVGAESPLETLFPGGSSETVDYLYREWPVARYMNGIAAAAVGAAAAAAGKPGRPVRIVEVGAGTGATTNAILPRLTPGQTVYQFTDVSDFFLGRAREQFAAYPFVRYGLLDAERDPIEQGYRRQSFDVFVAANALHATKDLDATLEHARSLLAPGGVLVLFEATAYPRWFDVTTGLIAGWQRFEDGWRSDHPLLTAERWAEALRAHGFETVRALPAADSPAAVLGQHVLIARVPVAVGPASADAPFDALTVDGLSTSSGLPSGDPSSDEPDHAPGGLADRLLAVLPDERHDLLSDYVAGHLVRVLRLDAGTPIDSAGRLLDLGLDSLMAVELRNRLVSGLGGGQKLPATLVFDYPSVSAIATYLERRLGGPDAVTGEDQFAGTAADTSSSSSAASIADLSDAEVERLLMAKIDAL